MRLLLIQGDYVGIYEDRKQLAVYVGAKQLDKETAEQTRLASSKSIASEPVQEEEVAHDSV